MTTDHNQKKNGRDGDNVIQFSALTAEQEKTLFFRHRTKYAEALARKKDADAELRNVCKTAKADNVSVGAIKLSLKDAVVLEAHVRVEVEMFRKVAGYLALPIGTQLSLLDEPDRKPSDEKAFDEGEVAGLEGKDCDPPYAGNLPQANHWRQGWNKGQEALRSKFTLSDEKNEAKPKRAKKDKAPAQPEAEQEQAPPTQPLAEGDEGFMGA